jgi:hypothetical protein
MESEKTIYWITLGVLALATINGFAAGHKGWGDRLADRSVAMVAQASGAAKNYAQVAGMVLGTDQTDAAFAPQALLDVQNLDVQNDVQYDLQPRLACAERILVKRQAQLARLQALKVRLRTVGRMPRTITWSEPHIVVEVPELPEIPAD